MIAYKVYMCFDGIACSDALYYNPKTRKIEIKEYNYNDNAKFTAVFRSKQKAKKKLQEFKEENEVEPGITFKIQKIGIY